MEKKTPKESNRELSVLRVVNQKFRDECENVEKIREVHDKGKDKKNKIDIITKNI